MDLETYRRDVRRTVRPELTERERLVIGGLGLASEAGEFANALNHQLHFGHPPDLDRLRDELGDVLWYVVFLCDTLGISLEDVMAANVEKRRTRYPNGWDPERSRNRIAEQGA
jgi:NTP pyrophosphatase (non-canonical NTP hydrolase)